VSECVCVCVCVCVCTAGLLKGLVGVTPVTVESFTAWRDKLEKAQEVRKKKKKKEPLTKKSHSLRGVTSWRERKR
jgi:hypothetical protein